MAAFVSAGSEIYTIFAWSSDAYGSASENYVSQNQLILTIGSDRPQDCLDVLEYDDTLTGLFMEHASLHPPNEVVIDHVLVSGFTLSSSTAGYLWVA